MGRADLREFRAVAAELGLVGAAQHDVSDDLHELKAEGVRGSQANGDFTVEELRAIAREFVGDRRGGVYE